MTECEDLVCHAAELAYEFQVESLTIFEFEEDERTLSRHMMRLWSNFAKHGNPNGDITVSKLMLFLTIDKEKHVFLNVS